MREFTRGCFVKFNSPTGSIGRVISRNHYGGCYVRFVFGRDVYGDIITGGIASCSDRELISVPRKTYQKARDGLPFKGDRQ